MTAKAKLIEVALPLEAINDAAAYDKLPGIGPHPKGLHKWWAPLPLPCARAVLFAALVDDPSAHPELFPDEESQVRERDRLFRLIRQLVAKGATQNERTFDDARRELSNILPDDARTVLDPFCGSGAIPLEAQRLGLQAYARDLNPVATLLTRGVIDIPARFADAGPVHAAAANQLAVGSGGKARGLAEDVRAYGRWMLERALPQMEGWYPTARVGQADRTVIAWIWCRTAKCPNPACAAEMPLISSYALSTVKGRRCWLVPIVDHASKTVTFSIESGEGEPPAPPKLGRGGSFRCVVCGEVADERYVKTQGLERHLGARLIAIVVAASAGRGRTYLPADAHHEVVANAVHPTDPPNGPLADDPRNIWCKGYGFEDVASIFTARQLAALTVFSDLIPAVRAQVLEDAQNSGMRDDGRVLEDGGTGATAYADAVATYLAFAVDRAVDFNNSMCRWVPGNEKVMNLFSRQAIPVVWDYAEANVTASGVGGFVPCSDYVAECLETVIVGSALPGDVAQADAQRNDSLPGRIIVSTDPPYYDNIAYSDLSDVFYVWLRHSLRLIFPDLLSTLMTPKRDELVATPYRFDGSREAARRHFEKGFLASLRLLTPRIDPEYPLTLYYAFKQSEGSATSGGTAADLTTGWETMLQALMDAGFQVTATWPVRASQDWRMVAMGTNALASYIVLACRLRAHEAPLATRREFNASLRVELPEALKRLQHGGVAPVDLAQASIGPGMAVFSRYSRVVEADGRAMTVRTALSLINAALDEVLAEQEAEFDADTRFAIAWYQQHGTGFGPYGDADVLARAKNTAVQGMQTAGVVASSGGKVRLLTGIGLPDDWDPATDTRLTVWEVAHQLANRLERDGELAAARLLHAVGGLGEAARDLAYRLHAIAERRGWSKEALTYNSLVVAWPEIKRLASEHPWGSEQTTLL